MKKKSIKLNAILNSVRILMTLLFPLISFPYASRVLGPDGIGKVDFSASVVSYFSLIASLGIGTYGIREAAKVRNNREKLSVLVHEIFLINSITTGIAYALFFGVIFKVVVFREYTGVLLVSSLSIGFTTMGMEWLYGALEEYKYITIRSIAFQSISLVMLFAFVKESDDYIRYAAIQVFSVVGSNVLNLIHSSKYVTWKKISKKKYELKKHIKPIFIIFGLNLASTVYMNLDKTMLGIMCNDREVGLYTAAMKFSRIILQLILAAGTVMVARLSYYYSNGMKREFQGLLAKVFHLTCILAIPAAMGLSLLSQPIIILFSGKNYVDATSTMQILSLLVPIVGISNLIAVQVFIPSGKEIYALLSSISAAVTNIILNSILIPRYGSNGAAVSNVLAELIALILCLILSRKLVNVKQLLNQAVKCFGIACVMIPLYLINVIISSNSIVIMGMTVLETVIFYFGLLLLLKDSIVLEGVEDIWKLIKKIKDRGL